MRRRWGRRQSFNVDRFLAQQASLRESQTEKRVDELRRDEVEARRVMRKSTSKLVEFHTWEEWVDYVKRPLPYNAVETNSRTGGFYFTQTQTFDQAVQLAVDGWKEMVTQSYELSDAIFDSVVKQLDRPEILYDVEGGAVDVSSFINGEPECWVRFQHEPVPAPDKVRTMVVNGFVSCGVDSESINARGAVLAALVQLLEFSGIRCEVIWHQPFTHRYQTNVHEIDFRVTVKRSDQELDMGRMMFALAHPAMFRRLTFAALELNPENHQYVKNYGQPTELIDEQDKGNIYLPCMSVYDDQWTNKAKARKWVMDELNKQGVKLSTEEK